MFLRCVEIVRNIYIYIYILWDMVFVICIRIICRYFVGHGSCIYILCETWSLKIYEKYVWKCKIDDMKVKYSK